MLNNHKSVAALLAILLVIVLLMPAMTGLSQPPAPAETLTESREQDQGTQKEISRISRLARSAENAGKMERALELWRAVIAVKPDDYTAFRGIQRALIELERYDEALEFIDQALATAGSGKSRLDPVSLTADRIELLYMADRPDKADEEMENALIDFRGQDRIYTEIASVLLIQRRNDQAISIIRRGRAESSNPHLFAREMARWLEARMNWQEAVEEYILYLDERHSRLNYVTGAIGDMPAASGADSIAVMVISQKIEDADEDFSVVLRRLMASLHFKAKRYQEALTQYKLLDRLGQQPGSELLQFADLLMNEGEYTLAGEAYRELIHADISASTTALALLGMGHAALAIGEIDSARLAYNSILTPGSPPRAVFEAYKSLGLLEFNHAGSPDRVRELLKLALKIADKARIPGDERDELAVISAISWAKEGNLERARRDLETIVRPKRRSSRAVSAARLELTRIAFRQGDLDEMQAQANALLIADPSSEYANDAIVLSALITDLKSNPDAIRALGRADLAEFMGNCKTAVFILDSLAVFGSPRVVEEALWQLYRLELKRNRIEVALGLLNRIIDLGESALRVDLAVFTAGQLCENRMENPQMAAEFYEQLLVEHPDSPLIDQARRKLKALIQPPS